MEYYRYLAIKMPEEFREGLQVVQQLRIVRIICWEQVEDLEDLTELHLMTALSSTVLTMFLHIMDFRMKLVVNMKTVCGITLIREQER